MAAIKIGSEFELDVVAGVVKLMKVDAAGNKSELADIEVPALLQMLADGISNAAVKEAILLAIQALIALTPA